MTRKSVAPGLPRTHQPGHWLLILVEEFGRFKGDLTCEALIAAMQAAPARDIDLTPVRAALPVRDVVLMTK
jgi:hypothetical protein